MHVWGLSVDLDSIAPFLFTALLIAYGLIYVVKNTASKYFVVDASFEGGAESAGSSKESGVVVRVMEEDRNCVVCGKIGTKRCSLCKVVRYCTTTCQAEHWNAGHKKDCGKIVVANGEKNVIAQKQLKKTLFPYDEFVKLYNWNNPGFPPCGLLNCGNSCFANVVLQCLTYTKPLFAYLLEKGHQRECKKTGWCFLCEFQTHVERASRRVAYSPVNILSQLPHIGGNLGFGNQEDAHEFMRFAIDSMQSVFLDQFGGEKALHQSSQETTLIQYIFGGHLLSQVKCTSCSKVSNRYESMMDLTVEIHGDNGSLEECLDQFTTPECLDGDNKYKCDGCNAYVMARKRLSIQQPPNILTIALKRFQGGRYGKINKRVTFPETLNLSPYMINAVDGTNVYHLYAVVDHIDMMNASYFGHYICYIKDFHGDWYKIDDCKVVCVDLDEVLSSPAYMLLYCRNRPRTLTQSLYELSNSQETVEKMESCSTSFQSVATSASIGVSSNGDVHAPVVPFSADDYGDSETDDEATSKFVSRKHENGTMQSLSSPKGTVVHENGHSYQQTELNNHELSDSGCSSSSDKVPSTYGNGNGNHNQCSAASPLLGKRPRNNSFEAELNDQSLSSQFQRFSDENLNVLSDPIEICGEFGILNKEIGGDLTSANGKFASCCGQEQRMKRSAKNGNKIGADSGHSDVCNPDGPKQRKNNSYQGLFRPGFLNQNRNKLKNKVDKVSNPPSYVSKLKNSDNCSSGPSAACSTDTSPKEKLYSNIEEMLCADVKGHMNMSISTHEKCDQEVFLTLPSNGAGVHTISNRASCSPDFSPEVKRCPNYDQVPYHGNYFSVDSTEFRTDIKILSELDPCTTNAKCSSDNSPPEALRNDTETVRVSGYPSNSSSSGGRFGFCPDADVDFDRDCVSPSRTSSSGGKFCPNVGTDGAPISPSANSSSGDKFCPDVGISGPSSSPSSTSSGGRFCLDEEICGGDSKTLFKAC